LLWLRPWLGPLLELAPADGTNRVFLDLAAVLIASLGYAYARAAGDPQRFRAYVQLGVIGKLLAVAVVLGHWSAGRIGWPLPLLAGGELILAALFFQYLRRSPACA
jgi:hypothetical protein